MRNHLSAAIGKTVVTMGYPSGPDRLLAMDTGRPVFAEGLPARATFPIVTRPTPRPRQSRMSRWARRPIFADIAVSSVRIDCGVTPSTSHWRDSPAPTSTVTMRWFDDLWLKEGFAEFMAYKTLEKVMPEYNAWKIFYERNKQAAYLTDSTKGTTPIYQEIPNLSAAKSAYGNIVYRKAPSFLRQAEFYLGEKEFQTAVRAFLKNHQYANAEWTWGR